MNITKAYFLSLDEKETLSNALFIYAHHQHDHIENMLDIVNAMYDAMPVKAGYVDLSSFTYDVMRYYRDFLREHPNRIKGKREIECLNASTLLYRMENGYTANADA